MKHIFFVILPRHLWLWFLFKGQRFDYTIFGNEQMDLWGSIRIFFPPLLSISSFHPFFHHLFLRHFNLTTAAGNCVTWVCLQELFIQVRLVITFSLIERDFDFRFIEFCNSATFFQDSRSRICGSKRFPTELAGPG